MHKVLRNIPPAQKTNPESLENTRDPSEYKPAIVKDFNDRYKRMFSIDKAKAKLVSVRQDSFQEQIAHVVLGEDIFDEHGKFLTMEQRSTTIERKAYTAGTVTVKRTPGESAYATWRKVEAATGFEENELMANLSITSTAHSAVYKVNELSLNWYGEVRVKFEYEEEVAPTL